MKGLGPKKHFQHRDQIPESLPMPVPHSQSDMLIYDAHAYDTFAYAIPAYDTFAYEML